MATQKSTDTQDQPLRGIDLAVGVTDASASGAGAGAHRAFAGLGGHALERRRVALIRFVQAATALPSSAATVSQFPSTVI